MSCTRILPMNDETRTAAAAGWLGIGLPLLVTIIGVYLQLSWWDTLIS